ncbi:hypothetical protein MYX77_08125 [Acidobacteriia bacterium AH_259_A11_L15]|nr:hypothetical protein [Acidobacteriia bacterium AH_259_A11_L15]
MDVGMEIAGRSVACEIVFTRQRKELFNLEKDSMAGWDEIWFCCPDEKSLKKLKDIELPDGQSNEVPYVKFKLLPSFL